MASTEIGGEGLFRRFRAAGLDCRFRGVVWSTPGWPMKRHETGAARLIGPSTSPVDAGGPEA